LRDILFSSDVCSAFDAFYRSNARGVFTLGGGEKNMISLLECIEVISRITGKKTDVVYKEERLGDLRYFVAENTRFKSATGWEPKVRPEEGIGKLINWIEENESLFVKRI